MSHSPEGAHAILVEQGTVCEGLEYRLILRTCPTSRALRLFLSDAFAVGSSRGARIV